MNKKILLSIPIALIMIAGVFAFWSISLRATEGNVNCIGSYCNKGDLNNDGAVNSLDYSIINYQFAFNGNNCTSPLYCNNADINKDGLISSLDYDIINQDFLGSDIVWSKIKFSAWHRDEYSKKNGNQGKGSIEILAMTSDGKRIVLNLHLDEKEVLQNTETRFYVDNTGEGIYWTKGSLNKVNLNSVKYDYNKITGIVNIVGDGDINFRVTGMIAK